MAGLTDGISDCLAGFGLVLRVPSIRKWAVIPILINAALFTLLAVLIVLYSDDVLEHFVGQASTTWGAVWRFLAWVAIVLFALILLVVLVNLLSNVVAAPFYTKLSEAALTHLTGRKFGQEGSVFAIALLTIYQEIQKLMVFVGVQAILLAFHFVPVAGTIISLAVTFHMLAFEFTDYALEAYGLPVTDRYKFLLANKWPMAGFGSVAFVLTLIPLANLFVAPAAVAGGAKLVVRLRGELKETP